MANMFELEDTAVMADRDCDHINAPGLFCCYHILEIGVGELGELVLLCEIDRLGGRVAAPAGAHLDKDKLGAIANNQVDLAKRAAPFSLDRPAPKPCEVGCRCGLAKITKLLSAMRHGVSHKRQ